MGGQTGSNCSYQLKWCVATKVTWPSRFKTSHLKAPMGAWNAILKMIMSDVIMIMKYHSNLTSVQHFAGGVAMCVCMCSIVKLCQLFATPWTVALQAPLSMGFSRQEYWGGLPFPPPGDLPSPGIEPVSPAAPILSGRFSTTEPPGKPWNSWVGVAITTLWLKKPGSNGWSELSHSQFRAKSKAAFSDSDQG